MGDASQALTDLTSHHIEGIAREGNTPFSMPLISHIEGTLWTGGCEDGLALPPEIEYVVSLYPWQRYAIDPARTRRLEFALFDSADVPDTELLDMLSRIVLDFMYRGPTLVHCQAGLNRSSLVAANALWLTGVLAVDAIALLREKRSPAVLCNAAFERWLLDREVGS